MPGLLRPWIILVLLTVFWSSVQGVPCGYPGSSINGRPSRVQESYNEGQAVTYTCDPGYFLMGPATRKCTQNGTWAPARVPLCDSRLAGLEETGTAESSQPLNQYPAGWAIDGDTATCSYSGRSPPRWWRLDLGRSYRILSVAITVADLDEEQNLAVYILGLSGNSAIYQRCASFSGKFASSSVVLPCASGGSGASSESGLVGKYLHVEDVRKDLHYFGLCEVDVIVLRDRYECGPPERPVNSYTVRLKPEHVEYRCVAGHRLVGNRRRQCLTNGQWSGNQPLCLEVKCPPPETTVNGQVRVVTGTTGQQAVLGNVAFYTCDPGFTLHPAPGSGTNGSRICNEEGTWSPEQPPLCLPVDCGLPKLPVTLPPGTSFRLLNGSQMGHGAMARLLCPAGYEPSSGADELIRCKGDGTWTKPMVTCLSGQHAPSPVEAAREDQGESLTLGLVLGLVGTVLLLTMVLAILCLVLRRRRRGKRSAEASSSTRGSGSLQTMCNGNGRHQNGDAGSGSESQEGLYSAPVHPARPVLSVIYDYPRRAPVAVPYPFTFIPVGLHPSRSPSKENIYEEIALNGGGGVKVKAATGQRKTKPSATSSPTSPSSRPPPHLDPEVLALYAQVDFDKKRQSRQIREAPDGASGSPQGSGGQRGGRGSGPASPAQRPEDGSYLPPVPPPPSECGVTVQNDIYECHDGVMVDNELYS